MKIGWYSFPRYYAEMDDARIFNIADRDGRFLCPACGLPGFFRGTSYDEKGGIIGTGICPCCLWEPGFDDMGFTGLGIVESLREYRAGWGSPGPQWAGQIEAMPAGWDGRRQFEHLALLAPFIL